QEAGEQDGHRQRQGKLLVDHADRAAHEGQREEYRRQYHGDTDDGASDLLHRLARGLLGRKPLFGHDPLDVLDHHNGIVHQNPDSQHHAEHGHHVDREADHRHHRKGTQQTDRHHDGRNQGIAEVLQEQEHHQKYQHHGFGQGHHHFLDRHVDEDGGVVGGGVFHVLGEQRRQF